MKNSILIALSISLLSSCNNQGKKAEFKTSVERKSSDRRFVINETELSKDFKTWYNYTYYDIRLSSNFTGLDLDSNKIEKDQFFRQLATGNFVAYKTAIKQNIPVYKLYKLKSDDKDIRNTITEMANTAITLSNMEGKQLPEYDFIDVKGNTFNKNLTKGNVVVVKCWFIRCVACVEEFPELNKLVDRYKDRSDIRFISLASDKKEDLLTFLEKKPFKYAVVPGMDNYMTNKLKVNAYPLHLLVNKEGKIIKATNSIDDLTPFLEIEMSRS